MADNKSYGAMAAMVIAIVFGAIGLATPEWTVVTDGNSSGVFKGQIFGNTFDIDVTEGSDALQATAAFGLIAILCAFIALCLYGMKMNGNSKGDKRAPMMLMVAALVANAICIIVYSSELYNDTFDLGYSWALVFVAGFFDAVAAFLVK